MSEVTETSAGVRTEIDLDAPTQLQASAPTEMVQNFLKTVPQEYAEKEWVKEVIKAENPQVELFKQFENQRSLIGRKSEGLKIPSAEAPETEWAEFHKALGVPESPDGYTYEAPKAPEGLEEYFKTDDNLLKTMKEAAHKAGVTPAGWQKIASAFDNYYAETLKESLAQVDAQLKELENTFSKHYGDKSPTVLASWQQQLQSAPDWAKSVLDAASPAMKAAQAAAFREFATKYIKEDSLDLNQAAPEGMMTQAQYADEYEKLFAKIRETSKNPHSAEHLQAKQQLATLRSRGDSIFKAK